ncbi:low molecular mass early light-inducible protein HV90, chloroplastic, partial [Haematococcus lacustris]
MAPLHAMQATLTPQATARIVPARLVRGALRVRASENNGTVPSTSSSSLAMSIKTLPALTWYSDTETIRDVFSVTGPLAERLNGRAAMWAFASFALTELKSHTPVLEQMGEGWLAAILFSLLITTASITPKLLSGVSLKQLHDSAITENMKGDGPQQYISYFDSGLELLLGRAAMVGVLGLVVTELCDGNGLMLAKAPSEPGGQALPTWG